MAITRRKFMGVTAAAVTVAGMKSAGKVWGANERIGLCTIGFNGQGRSHINDLLERREKHNIEFTALCDVDERVLRSGVRGVSKKQEGREPTAYTDMRELMQDANVDAITIATPNHWHALAAIWGCQAGKDVYVEKPLSHNVWEGRQLVAAAKQHDRIVQHGTQSRSDNTLLRDMKLIHEGFIGKVSHSRGYVYKNGNRRSIGKGLPGEPPSELHYDLWQGPASPTPYQTADDGKSGLWVHYNWHWFWNWGNGEIGNQGVHEMDIACWSHNRGLPVKIMSQGGRFGWDDDAETPNTQATSFTYEDGSMMTFEVRNLGSFHEADAGACSNSVFGSEGYYVRNRGFFDYQNKPVKVEAKKPKSLHKFDRFLTAVRDRDHSLNPCDADVGHISSAHCHLGNVAYRLGRSLEFDPATEKFVNDDDANQHLSREYTEGFEVPQLA